MAARNRYVFRSKISSERSSTVNRIIRGIRERIATACKKEAPFSGEVEVDESYFGAHRDRGARGKTIVFGIIQRQGKVYTEIVSDCSRASGNGKMKSTTNVNSNRLCRICRI